MIIIFGHSFYSYYTSLKTKPKDPFIPSSSISWSPYMWYYSIDFQGGGFYLNLKNLSF
jgi:hypothetical protein